MHRLRNAMYVQYMDLLNTKVEKQRGRMHMCHLHFKDPLEHGEKKTITEQQLPYVRLSHDVKYLQSVPKSSNYLIVGLQNELSRSGVLKSRADHEVFHHLIQMGAASSQLKEKLLDVKSKMTACKSLPSFHLLRDSTQQTADDPSIKKGQKQLSNDSFPGLLPCQPQAHHLSKHREAQEEHEKRLPKLPLSRLPELQLLPEQSYKAQDMDRLRLNERHPRQEMYLHQLRQMYYLSLSNMASSRRLLEKNGLFADFEEEHSVHNLVAYLFPNENKDPAITHNEPMKAKSTMHALQKRHRCQVSKDYTSEESKENSDQTRPGEGRPVENLKGPTENKVCACTPSMGIVSVPLTMEEVVMTNPVMEAKLASTYWINYTKKENESSYLAGKKVEKDGQPLQGKQFNRDLSFVAH